MNQYWVKSVILHISIVLILALSGLKMCSKDDEKPEEISITVDLMPIGEKTNVKPAPKQEEVKPKPTKKPEQKPEPEPKKTEPKKPDPKPEPKPELKKPDPKTVPLPEPKKPEPKKPEPAKHDPSELDDLLKTLEDKPTPPKVKSDQTENTDKNSKSTTPVDMNKPLTVSEKSAMISMIMEQIKVCWNVPAGAKDAGTLKPVIDVDIERDGTIRFVGFAEEGRYNSDPYYQVAADAARRAVLDPRCNPLRRLPPFEYNKWNELSIKFNPESIIN
jgi:outer membrane biosynthesis protein TonB